MRRFVALVIALLVCFSGSVCLAGNVNFSGGGVDSPSKLIDGLTVGASSDLQPGWYRAVPASGEHSKLTIVDVVSFDEPVIVASYAWWPDGLSLLSENEEDPEESVFPLWEGCIVLSGYHSALEYDSATGDLIWSQITDAPAVDLVFVAPLGAAPASEASEAPAVSDGEIVFRGIPWLVSISDAVELLCAEGELPEGNLRAGEKMYSWGKEYTSVSVPNGGFKYSISGLGNKFFVAGYSVGDVYLYALYNHSDGNILREASSSRLYKAEYFFDVKDKSAAYSGLFAKMCGVYGDPSDAGETGSEKYAIWNGDDNTGVVLRFACYGGASLEYLSLSYGLANADVLIEELNAAFALEAQKSAEENDGL